MAAEEGQVFGCHTVDEWKGHFQKGVDSKKLVVIDFTATWCGPCRFIAPFFTEYAKMAAEEGQVFGCHTVDEWKGHFQKGVDSKKLVVIDFTATWCGPCRFIAPIFTEYAKKFTHVIFLKVDVDELKAVAAEFKVEAMPTFVFLKDGLEVDRVVGARKEDLEAKINFHGAVTA